MSIESPQIESYKAFFFRNFEVSSGSKVELNYLRNRLYLREDYKTIREFKEFLKTIIFKPLFIMIDDEEYLENYKDKYKSETVEQVKPTKTEKKVHNLEELKSYRSESRNGRIFRSYEKESHRSESRNGRSEKSRRSESRRSYDRESQLSELNSKIEDLEDLCGDLHDEVATVGRRFNGMQSEFQKHGDIMYSTVKRLEAIRNQEDHEKWLQELDIDEISEKTRKILFSKFLHSNINRNLQTMSEVLNEQDGRKHNILLVVDAIKEDETLENRSVWTNSNRGKYSFQMHDEISDMFFTKKPTIVSDKSKYDISIREHIK